MFSTERSLESFSEIIFNCGADLYLYQGDTPSVKVTANKDIVHQVRTKKRRNRLRITRRLGVKFWNWGTNGLEIHLTVTNLKKIKVNGGGHVLTGSPVHANQLKIISNDTGTFNIALEVGDLTVASNGTGEITLHGSAGKLMVKASGIGSIDASNLIAREAVIKCEGIGSCRVNATHHLDARLNGIGSIIYYGNPELNKKNNGIGSIRQVGTKTFLEESIEQIMGTEQQPPEEQQEAKEEDDLFT